MSAPLPDGAYPPGRKLKLGSGKNLIVGAMLAKGGQGYVYEVANDSSMVFKQIKPEKLPDSPDLEQRLAAMIASRPRNWRESSGHVLLTWPHDSVLDGSRFVGFVMPRIDLKRAAEIHMVSDPSERREPGRKTPSWVAGFTWKYLLQTAANLSLATDALHQGGYVFGDFNMRNILVTSQAQVTLIDCDSMQVPNPSGPDFLCEVGLPEYTAPELRGADKSIVRDPSSDLFPLAVHIHQLLLEGARPFDGLWHDGEKPKSPALAVEGLYVYAGDRRLSPHPLWVSFGLLPRSLQDLFRRAFVTGARDPSLRPHGREWHAALEATAADLKTCKRVKTHIYPAHNASCPWCEYHAAAQTASQTALPPARPPVLRPVPATPRAPTAPVLQTAPHPAPRPAPPVAARPNRRRTVAWMIAFVVAGGVAINAVQRSSSDATSGSEPAVVAEPGNEDVSPTQSTSTSQDTGTASSSRATTQKSTTIRERPASTRKPSPSRTTAASSSSPTTTEPSSGGSSRSGGGGLGGSAGTVSPRSPSSGLTGTANPAPAASSGGGLSGNADSGGGGGGLSGSASP